MWIVATAALAAPTDPRVGVIGGPLDLPSACTVFADSRPPEIRETGSGALVATGVVEGGLAVFRFSDVRLDAPLLVTGDTPTAILSTGDLSVTALVTSSGPSGGYAGGAPSGPGAAGAGSGAGGGFGGAGGLSVLGWGAGPAYGDLAVALRPGSGGAGADNFVFGDTGGGRGGAALELGAAGRVFLSADLDLGGEGGQAAFLEQSGGGGSGGGLLVHAGRPGSACGARVDVTGGPGGAGVSLPGGGGGGGRALWVAMPATCALATDAGGGSGWAAGGAGVVTSADPDRDGDGLGVNGGDCDDYDGGRHPGAPELCNGVDDDCDGAADDSPVPYYPDADGDGDGDHAALGVPACPPAPGAVANADDCDDTRATVFLGNPEACDGLDNDCVNGVDDGFALTPWFLDGDHDGFGSGSAQSACAAPPDHAPVDGDCDDADPLQGPTAVEQCNQEDDDCNGAIDDGVAVSDWYEDGDGDGVGGAFVDTTCKAPDGTVASTGDCDDHDDGTFPGADEVCDEEDQDCDGVADDGLVPPTWFPDADGDGYGVGLGSQRCTPSAGESAANGDCDDVLPGVHPGADEVCNGIDDDCDGLPDEDLPLVDWFPDLDGDGYGTAPGQARCGPSGAEVPDDGDCDDADAEVSPAESEVPCNAVDDDCDANTPDQIDFDGDGWDTCDDCADGDPDVNPLVPEALCNGLDDDCDPATEDDPPDLDGDGHLACVDDCREGDDAVPGPLELACNGIDDDCDPGTLEGVDDDLDGAAVCAGDCADDDPGVLPGAPERCDGLDQDCDGAVDEGLPVPDWYVDADGDGFGGDPVTTCGGLGRSPRSGDCDDGNASVAPGGVETACNGLDDDCDPTTPDGSEVDADADGLDACADCDDQRPLLAEEVACNGRDDDCDESTPDGDEIDLDGDGLGACEDCDEDHVRSDEAPCNGRDDDCDDGTPDRPDGDGDGVSACDDCDDGDPTRSADCGGETAVPGDTADPDGDDGGRVDPATLADRGCRCDASPGAAPAWLLLALAPGLRRRRETGATPA